jgi:fimbrial isopeptide formation D2 family protein/LPXTG-motif cell wall-anchored protein
MAQVGTDVDFTATVTKKAGAEKYTYHDTMTSGLSFKPESLTVKVGGVDVPASGYTVTAPAGTETFKIEFKDSYIKTLADETDIEIAYTATITESALTLDPEKNTAYLSYGNEDAKNHTPITEVEVYNAQISVNKENDKGEPLAGAGFVLQNAEGKYYKLDNGVVTWVDSIDDADEHFSADGENGTTKGAVAPFTGIANGTYTLIEKTVPGGYNKVGADPTFTVAEHDYTAANLEQSATVENESGVVLPSTGGIGTTIFYIVGAVLVLGAAIVLIAKRRASVNA